MGSSFVRRALATTASVALLSGALMLQSGGSALAQTATDAKIKALEDQVNQLQRSINELKASESQSAAQAKAAADQARAAAAQAQSAASQVAPPPPPVTALGTPYPTTGAPPGVHFNVVGQDFQVYGRAHVSAFGYNAGGAKGGVEIESNQSYLGFRTARQIWAAPGDLSFIAQSRRRIRGREQPDAQGHLRLPRQLHRFPQQRLGHHRRRQAQYAL